MPPHVDQCEIPWKQYAQKLTTTKLLEGFINCLVVVSLFCGYNNNNNNAAAPSLIFFGADGKSRAMHVLESITFETVHKVKQIWTCDSCCLGQFIAGGV